MQLDLSEAIEAVSTALWNDIETFNAAEHPGYEPITWAEAAQEHAKHCRTLADLLVTTAAPILEWQVREEVAREIEALNDQGSALIRCGLVEAAAIARNHTQAAGTPEHDAPAQPTQERTLS